MLYESPEVGRAFVFDIQIGPSVFFLCFVFFACIVAVVKQSSNDQTTIYLQLDSTH